MPKPTDMFHSVTFENYLAFENYLEKRKDAKCMCLCKYFDFTYATIQVWKSSLEPLWSSDLSKVYSVKSVIPTHAKV